MATHTGTAVDFLQRTCDAARLDSAYADPVAPAFRRHNPWFAGEADSLRRGMADCIAQFPDKALTVHRTVEQGDLVAVYSHVKHAPGESGHAVMHLFRFEDGRIAELRDLAREVPADSSDALGMFWALPPGGCASYGAGVSPRARALP